MQFKSNTQAGFTLLELLISIVIVSVIMTVMLGALRLGIRAWEKGEKGIQQEQRIRIIKALMRQQIASMCMEKLFKSENQLSLVPFVLKGGNDSMAFVSNYAVLPGTETIPVYSRYFIEKEETDRLVIIEKGIGTLLYKEIDALGNEEEGRVLIRNIKDFSIQYLKEKTDGTREWLDSWNMGFTDEVSFPAAVKVNFMFDGVPVSFIENIMSQLQETSIGES